MANTNRSLKLNQTTPATGPAGSASHVIFTEDGSQLVASVKGVPPTPGFLAVWDVAEDGSLSTDFKSMAPATGGLLPFSMTVIPGKNAILATDAGIGFDIFDFGTGAANNTSTSVALSTSATASVSTAVSASALSSEVESASASGSVSQSASAVPSASSVVARAISSASATSPVSASASIAPPASTSTSTVGNSTVASVSTTPAAASTAIDATGARNSAVKIDGQGATCWSSFSTKTGNFYLTDIGTSIVTEVSIDNNLKGR